MKTKRGQSIKLTSLIVVTSILLSDTVLAQTGALEEIIVTAQRREQSLQEVPISIEAISGEEIRNQGFYGMDQLADFSPTILIDERIQDQDIAIRAFGTTGNNLSLEQAVPTFVDGVHFGRSSNIKNAFLDLERVEVLRGPQPVYFGQNATAGAFSLTTRKPGPEWQGDLNGQIGNKGRRTLEGAMGGPITETLGIRVAGKWDKYDGHLTDIISGDHFPSRRDYAGRVILQWTPNDRFQATAKYQITDYDGGSDGNAISLNPVCRDHVPSPSDPPGYCELTENLADQVFLQPFEPFEFIPLTYSHKDGLGIRTGPRYFYQSAEYDNGDAQFGNVDIREFAKQHHGGDISGREHINPWDVYLNLTYRLDNGIELSSMTAYTEYYRYYLRDNSNSPFLNNAQFRDESQDSWSQEFRLTSPTGGTFEWMAGAYVQYTYLEVVSDTLRSELRRARRLNLGWDDGEWMSAFATVTYNFLGDKASIDLGARYTDIEKNAAVRGFSANYILPIEPVSTPGYLPTDEAGGGFYYPFNQQRFIPDEWDAQPVAGMTTLTTDREGGPHSGTYKQDRIDPQITLRYRPTDDISAYAKWARAFKAGAFGTSAGTIPESDEDYVIGPEFAQNWEMGAKGTFLEGRARAGLSLYWMEIRDLQIPTTQIEEFHGSGTSSTNAGLQRSRGAEFEFTWLAADRLTLGLTGSLMDAKMVEFTGAGCTNVEFLTADTGPCISEEESEELVGSDDLAGIIDRSGQRAPRAPRWVLVGDVDYWMPVFGANKLFFSGKFKASDGYITNVEDFDLDVKMNTHYDMNLKVGIGDQDDTWSVSVYGRNMLEPIPSYNPEFDTVPSPIRTGGLSPSHLMSYGVQLQYNYR